MEANPRNWTRKPNGTGPYKMVEWRLNERIILEANDRYYLGAPTDRSASCSSSPAAPSLTQYENDEMDVAGIGMNDIERVQSTRDPLNKEYKTGPNLSISYIGFNTKTPPFDDPKVRQAFAMAIDREQIARVVLKNMPPVATGIMMPGLPGYNQQSQGSGLRPGSARKQLLAESKYGSAAGLGTVTMTEIGGGANVGVATRRRSSRCGATTSASRCQSPRRKRPASSTTWTAAGCRCSPSAGSWTTRTRRTSSTCCSTAPAARTTPATPTRRSTPLSTQARTELGPTKRLQLYQQAEQIIIQDAPWIPLYLRHATTTS